MSTERRRFFPLAKMPPLLCCRQEVKKVGVEARLQDDALRDKFGLDLDLVAENKDDARIAELMQFSTVECELT